MMPCGGITPVVPFFGTDPVISRCFSCGKPVLKNGLFVEEWDAVIHRECLGVFLVSPEGEIVIHHGHEITVPELSA